MSDLLKITKTEGKVITLHLAGKLDGQTETELLGAARAEFDAGAKSLLLDFSELTMITSAGLRALHTIYKIYTPEIEVQAWSAEHKGETFKSPYFKIAQPSSDIHYVLSISGFLQSIYIYPSLQEAVDSFSS
ncbi:MAG: STAS domain-containing protein [Chloroflexi bacterium]|nr:STAS domain-containing protein [Chloroflexota bacterium]MBI3169785.1 STAS domain-containing protein [Chloroflexota bacterium]